MQQRKIETSSMSHEGGSCEEMSNSGKIPGRIPRKRAFFGGFFQEGHVSGKIPRNMPPL